MESNRSNLVPPATYPVRYTVVGASYRNVPVEQREALARFGKDQESLLSRVKGEFGASEAALISTCNRFEIVSVAPIAAIANTSLESQNLPHKRVKELFHSIIGRTFDAGQLYSLENEAAIRHVFRVAASLDSMVLGESQIVGQVKESYQLAVQHGMVGKYLHHLFQFAFSIAKKVRSNTAVAGRGVSVSYVTVRLAEQIFGNLKDVSVLIIGSGAMAELTGLHLMGRGCAHIKVANRTISHAFELARRLDGSAIDLADIEMHLADVDMVISSVSDLDKPLIEASTVRKLKRSKPLFLVDLGVPRNLSPALEGLENVYLYNIDDLSAIADDNLTIREEAAKEADVIIEHGLFRFERWLIKVTSEPSIIDFREKVRALCEEELTKALSGRLGEGEQEVILRLARRLSQRMSHDVSRLMASLPGGELSREEVLRIVFDEYLKSI